MQTTIDQFNKIRWHDSGLLGVSFYRVESEEQVKLSLELLGEDGVLSPIEVTFRECAYIQADVYLEAKRMCADAISDAECTASSDWKKAVSDPGPCDPIRGDRRLEDYLHFRISLCPPGGRLDILARSFATRSTVAAS